MLTLDLDRTKKRKVQKKAMLMKKMFPDKRVMYRVSCNNKGGHVKVMGVSLPMDEEIRIRLMMGDDEKRISKDIERSLIGLPRQIMFDKKINIKTGEVKKAEEWKMI